MAYLHSAAFLSRADLDDAHGARAEEMAKAMRDNDDAKVFALAQETIAEFYLDLEAHKARYQSCQLLKRTDCARYKAISLGLLRSIVDGRDGKTCATGWEAVRGPEEYFVMRMVGLHVLGQSLIHDGHTCDALQAEDKHHQPITVYFDVTAMFEAESRALRGSGP